LSTTAPEALRAVLDKPNDIVLVPVAGKGVSGEDGVQRVELQIRVMAMLAPVVR
jgi:hypothetical protein